MSEDKVFLSIGANNSVSLSDPQALNSYTYARNNPLTLEDIDGNAFMQSSFNAWANSRPEINILSSYSGNYNNLPYFYRIQGSAPNTVFPNDQKIQDLGKTAIGGAFILVGGESTTSESSSVMLYRSMKEGTDGMPMTGPSASKLGVRSGKDITLDSNGTVHPNSGGMSVSPGSPYNLPKELRSNTFGGESRNATWCMNSCSLPESLKYSQDSAIHGTIQPNYSMPFSQFSNLIESTKSLWTKTK